MKKLGTLALAFSCLAGAGFAQTEVAAPAAPDAAKLVLAHDVIKATQADRMIDGISAQIKQMTMAQTARMLPPEATEEQKAKALAVQGEIMDLAMAATKDMIGKLDGIYADVYSTGELEALKAFFTSAEGRSMIEKQPVLMQKMMPLMQQMQAELMPKINEIIGRAKAELTPPKAPISATTPPIEVPAVAPKQ